MFNVVPSCIILSRLDFLRWLCSREIERNPGCCNCAYFCPVWWSSRLINKALFDTHWPELPQIKYELLSELFKVRRALSSMQHHWCSLMSWLVYNWPFPNRFLLLVLCIILCVLRGLLRVELLWWNDAHAVIIYRRYSLADLFYRYG